jgi:hypothetical protein
VLCHVLPGLEFRVERARFRIPEGSATPSLVEMRLGWEGGGSGEVAFEWRHGGQDVWDITLEEPAAAGTLVIRGVRTLLRNGEVVQPETPDHEYAGVYREFAADLARGESRVSLREMRIIDDAHRIAEVEHAPPF